LIPRAISHLYREIAERPQLAFTVRVSYLEIYNEQVVDLLSTLPDAASTDGNLTVVEDKHGTQITFLLFFDEFAYKQLYVM
jgi:kinesin family member 6/9